MKKLMFGIAGVMAVLASANAAETADIKAACQASDKTLWVERNKVCIPKNPCKDSNYEKYCNRIYKDLEVFRLDGDSNFVSPAAMLLVEAYAKGHGLSCSPVDTKSKMVGQDYITCMGDDVMVFEFDDVNDTPVAASFSQSRINEYTKKYRGLLCEAMGGAHDESGVCHNVSKNQCEQLDNMADSYGAYPIRTNWNCYGNHMDKCCIYYNWRSVLD